MKPHKRYIAPDGLEYAVYPCERMIITQGSNQWSHSGCMANDVVNESPSSTKKAYWAPCTMKCMGVYPSAGQSWWQSVEPVHIKKGDEAVILNIMFAHDDTLNCYQGQVVQQGEQIGNMGVKGVGTGIHVHIQVGIGKYVTWGHVKGQFTFNGQTYGCYGFTSEPLDLDDVFYVDDTNVIQGLGADWKCIPKNNIQTAPAKPAEAAKPQTKEQWLDTEVHPGDIVKSISLKISGYHNGFVLVKNLGGWIPEGDLSEAPDTGDGACDGFLATDTAKVYLDPVKVEKIDPVNDWVRVHGYWVPAKYLLVKKG